MISRCNYGKVAFNLVLEGVGNLFQFSHIEEDDAIFTFKDFLWITNHGEVCKSKMLKVTLDLNLKSMKSAKLDSQFLTPEETVTLLVWHEYSGGHFPLHALANWSVDIYSNNPLIKISSIATITYNYMGMNGFSSFSKFCYWAGILNVDNSNAHLEMVEITLNKELEDHRKIIQLKDHSNLAMFLLDIHHPFKRLFNKYADDFQESDWHSLFSSTVLHSIAHSMAEKNLVDPFILLHDHSKFGNIAKMSQLIRMGFVPEIPFVLFTRKAKDVKSGFYHDLYKMAKGIDKQFADMIDICIIK